MFKLHRKIILVLCPGRAKNTFPDCGRKFMKISISVETVLEFRIHHLEVQKQTVDRCFSILSCPSDFLLLIIFLYLFIVILIENIEIENQGSFYKRQELIKLDNYQFRNITHNLFFKHNKM